MQREVRYSDGPMLEHSEGSERYNHGVMGGGTHIRGPVGLIICPKRKTLSPKS